MDPQGRRPDGQSETAAARTAQSAAIDQKPESRDGQCRWWMFRGRRHAMAPAKHAIAAPGRHGAALGDARPGARRLIETTWSTKTPSVDGGFATAMLRPACQTVLALLARKRAQAVDLVLMFIFHNIPYANPSCRRKAKMSALSKVGMSVFSLLVVRFGGCGSDGCGE